MTPERDFDAFFREVIGRAVTAAWRVLADRAAAEDAAVEALARAHIRWARLRHDPYRQAWVLRVTINAAIDMQRSDRRRRLRQQRSTGLTPTRDFDEATVDRLAIGSASQKLPRRQRSAVALRYLADLPEAEIAAVMGISTGAVKAHLHRAMATLREEMRRQSPQGACGAPN